MNESKEKYIFAICKGIRKNYENFQKYASPILNPFEPKLIYKMWEKSGQWFLERDEWFLMKPYRQNPKMWIMSIVLTDKISLYVTTLVAAENVQLKNLRNSDELLICWLVYKTKK